MLADMGSISISWCVCVFPTNVSVFEIVSHSAEKAEFHSAYRLQFHSTRL